MEKQLVIEHSLELVKKSPIVMVGSIDNSGFPNIKAMLNCKSEGLKKFWFSTNTSSKRVEQFKANPQACIYYLDQDNFKGLMLKGKMEVLHDEASRKLLWKAGDEIYYPLGINDPDYSVLCFTAEQGNYYYNLEILYFDIE